MEYIDEKYLTETLKELGYTKIFQDIYANLNNRGEIDPYNSYFNYYVRFLIDEELDEIYDVDVVVTFPYSIAEHVILSKQKHEKELILNKVEEKLDKHINEMMDRLSKPM